MRNTLKVFFWIALVINLAHYAILGSVFAKRFNDGSMSDPTARAFITTYFVMVLYPVFFIGLAQVMLRDYFPDKNMPLSKRRLYNILGVVQLVFALPIAAFGVFAYYQLVHQDPSVEHPDQSQMLMFYAWAMAMIVASLLNSVAAIVVWRTVWTIRRKFRAAILESFDQV